MIRNCIFLLLMGPTALCWAQENISWSDQIACLVYSHCTPCHNSSGIAPFALESYDDAFANRFRMEEAISQKRMPPWSPDPSYSRLKHERLLTDHEIEVFRVWVENGAQKGDEAQAPTVPVDISNIQIEEPDFTYTLPPYTVPDAQELDLYRCFVVPNTEDEDKFITGVEIIPGNRSIVHHVLVFADTSDVPAQLDAEDPGSGYTCFGGIGSDAFTTISGWAPGSSANFAPAGMGILLPKGADLVVQLHYPEGSAGEVDATTINLQYAEESAVRPLFNIPALNHFTSLSEPLIIPANSKKTFYAEQEVPFDLTITGIAPHAHLICESMRAFATTPAGDTIQLIDVPHWDFEWQGFYDFQVAKYLPAGSILHGVVSYNNTISNPHLPSGTPVDVEVGESTTDEMLLFFMTLSFYLPGDENMIIDTASHLTHHQNCSTEADLTLSALNDSKSSDFIVGPNPTSGAIFVSLPEKAFRQSKPSFILTDVMGRELFSRKIDKSNASIDLPDHLSSGIYWFYFRNQSGVKMKSPGKISIVR